MALMRNKIAEIPSDAVLLNESDALKYQIDLIRGWTNKNDVYVFLPFNLNK